MPNDVAGGPGAEQPWLQDFLSGSQRPLPVYHNLNLVDFWEQHLDRNIPMLLASACTSQWPCRRDWAVTRPVSGETGPHSLPNFDALRKYSHHVVPVANTLKREYTEFERSEMTLGEVLDIWEGQRGEKSGEGSAWYVKDYHLMAEIEGEGRGVGEVYEVPQCLRDDWLNPHFTPLSRTLTQITNTNSSDFRFTYLGPAGTFTPFHRDVYASYSWSANVVGRKAWWLFNPSSMPEVRRIWQGIVKQRRAAGQSDGTVPEELPFDLRDVPEIAALSKRIIQEEGEVIFVPSGWYHQVVNLDFCISINHNFLNAATLPRVFTALCDAQDRVEESLADVKEMVIHRLGAGEQDASKDEMQEWEVEWTEEVQKVLEMDAGWGWKGFWECVELNIKDPPAAYPSAIEQKTHQYILETIAQYKLRREWYTLPITRDTVQMVERIVRS